MGFIDRLDDALTLARASHSAQKEAKKFARSVKLGKTYYTKTKTNQPYAGNPDLLEEHVFTDISIATALPRGAAALWLQCGPVYDDRSNVEIRGLMTMREWTRYVNEGDGPDISGSLHDYSSQPKRRSRAA